MRCKRKQGIILALASVIGILFYFRAGNVTNNENNDKFNIEVGTKAGTSVVTTSLKTRMPARQLSRLRNLSFTLLKAENYITKNAPVRRMLENLEICVRYNSESRTIKKTYRSVWTGKDTLAQDITLVTVMTVDKFPALDRILENWAGPVSIGLYVGESDTGKLLQAIWGRPVLVRRKNIELSIVAGVFEFLPINWLRQVALEQSRTRFVALFDVDMVPSITLYETLLKLRSKYTDTKRVLVIPAFELINETKHFTHPRNKAELISYWDKKLVQPFLFSEYNRSHSPTNFETWRKSNSIYSVGYTFRFEPYIFADRKVLPKYDVRFHGRYYNKISLFCEMHLMKFTFDVIPKDFAIHYPHPRAIMKEVYKAHEPCSRELIMPCRKKVEDTGTSPSVTKPINPNVRRTITRRKTRV